MRKFCILRAILKSTTLRRKEFSTKHDFGCKFFSKKHDFERKSFCKKHDFKKNLFVSSDFELNFFNPSDFGFEKVQRVRFCVKNFTTCQILIELLKQASDFEVNILQCVRF